MRPRRHGNDYAYGIEHSERFPEQYQRIEHRFKLADIDWCEFCGYCHKPVTLIEMVRDKQQPVDLADKSTTVIGHLAQGVSIPAYVIGVYIERPAEVQAEIDQLTARILDLARQWPITRIRAQMRVPHRGPIQAYTPSQWWELVALRHSEHHELCPSARRSREVLANPAWRASAPARHRGLWVPSQPPLSASEWTG
jgi:hypothetical protein